MKNDEFLKQVIDIDPLELEEHFRRLPAELAYYNSQYADAYARQLDAKRKLDRAHADTYHLVLDSGKKMTVQAINAAIEEDEMYTQARKEFTDAEADKQRLRGKVDVVLAKKEMLISLGAHMRSEMQTQNYGIREE